MNSANLRKKSILCCLSTVGPSTYIDIENHVCIYDMNIEVKLSMEQTGTTEEEMRKWEDGGMTGNKLNMSFIYAH